jgi:trehalose 6-phosphate synthase/phosphatase
MNLVAKEFIASKTDQKGVLILSEMAGAVKEMSEALIINPNNFDEIAEALKTAMLMPAEEQVDRIGTIQKRLSRYNVSKWANDFVESLEKTQNQKQEREVNKITSAIEATLIENFRKAKKRILFLDYDGTLVGFKNKPEDAKPDDELYDILDRFAAQPGTEVVLISGRDKETFTWWFDNKNYGLIAEHGVWHKFPGEDWSILEPINCDWKEMIHPVLEFYVDRTPGSFIEEKNYSLVWHYRKVDPELGTMRAIELSDELTSLIANYNLDILEGSKVIEIKNSGINKGRGALHRLGNNHYDYIFAAGDDWTDEYLFEELPEKAVTIKIGIKKTKAQYNIETVDRFRKLLAELSGF